MNYFVLFLAGLWYTITRTDFVSELFTIYDNYLFGKSKSYMLGVKRRHGAFFGRSLVMDSQLKGYKYGTNQDADQNFLSAWKNKGNEQFVLECLGRIEMALARDDISSMKDRLYGLKVSLDPESQKLAEMMERQIKEKEQDIMHYEKMFYAKTGESEYA